jgi:primary-amine oxidase
MVWIEFKRHHCVLTRHRPYGGLDIGAENRRYFQGLCFAQDTRNGNADSNFYAYPLPLIPVMDAHTREIVRVDRLATGGKGDSLTGQTHLEHVLEHCEGAEYVPELLEGGTRKDVKPINITQPEGPSFRVTDESLVEWQKWSFRVSFNPREGAVLHDVHYDGRSIMYRMSISEMSVPYADARPPFHRKQAFDFGDGGAGNCANNLSLGCDCLGVIKYFDAVIVSSEPKVHPNVVCLHEQDNGIGWKHSTYPLLPAYETCTNTCSQLENWSCRCHETARARRPVHHHPCKLRIRLRVQARHRWRHHA